MEDRRPVHTKSEEAVRRRQEVFSLALIGLLFLATATAAFSLRPGQRDFGRESEGRPAARIGMDPNAAHWFELAQLPGVGESLARKIVEYRDLNRDRTLRTNRPCFEKAEDLLPVKGIGEKMLARLRPFLVFPGPAPQETPPDRVDSLSTSR